MIRFGRRLIVAPATQAPTPLRILPVNVPSTFRAGQSSDPWAIYATGGRAPYSFAITSGSFPGGMVLQANGTVPSVYLGQSTQGDASAVVTVTDADGSTATATVLISVDYALLIVTVGSIPSAVVGETYAQIQGGIIVTGGDGSYTVTKRSGTYFPPTLSLFNDPVTTYTWDVVGDCDGGSGQTFTAILDITSGDGQSTTATIQIPVQAVTANTPLTMTYPIFPNATVGSSYTTVTPTVSNAVGAKTFSISGAGLPGNMAFSTSTGAISVTGTLSGSDYGLTFPNRVTVSDAGTTPPQTAYADISITVNQAVLPSITLTMPTFTTGTPGSSYSKAATAASFAGNCIWTLEGILPSGISGVESGTGNDTFTFTATSIDLSAANSTRAGKLTATDSADPTNTITKSWVINVGPLSAAWVAPSQTADLPDLNVVANVSESNTYNTADYIDAGDATDLVVGIEWVDTPNPGLSVSMIDTSATGSFNVSYDSVTGSNPSVNTDYDYRLTLTYTDPTGDPPVTDNEADWIARSTGAGVMQVEDFRSYSSTAAMLAASDVGSNQTNATSSNGGANYMVELDLTDGITAGRCLRITTFEGAGSQGGGFGRTYRSDGAAVNGFYFQFAVKMNEAALYWEPAGTNSDGTADTKKIMQLESYGTGQVSVLAGTHGFPTLMVNGSEGVKRVISSGTGYGGDAFRQTAIDNGTTVTSGNRESYAQRYGLSEGLTEAVNNYGPSGLVNQRGFEVPEPNAIIGGSVPYTLDGWTVIEVYVYNDLSNNANDVFKMWAAPYGAAPKLVVDNAPGGAGTISGGTLGVPGSEYYKRWEALNYPTRRSAETGRPAQVQKYDQLIPSTNWIPFPGHLTGTEP